MIVPGLEPRSLANHVVSLWRRLKDERIHKERIWQECWLAYNSKFGQTWDEVAQYRSRRYLPFSRQAVDNVSAHLTQGLMPHDDWFNVVGRTPDDDRSAKMMAPLMKWQHYRTNWRRQVTRAIRQMCIFGNAPWAVLWKNDVRYVPDMAQHGENLGAFAATLENGDASGPQPLPAVPLMPVRKYDGPELVVGNLFDFVQDRNGNDEYAPRIMRYYRTKAYLRRMAEPDQMGYSVYDPQAVEAINNENIIKETSDSLKRSVDALMGFYDIPKDAVEVLEAWGDFEIDGQEFHNHVLVVANRNTVLRFEPNPYSHGRIPWQLATLNEDPLETYAVGTLEPSLGLQDGANARFNQVIEANALAVNPQFTYVNDGTFDAENFISAAGALHPVASQGNIQPLAVPSNASLGMSEVGFLASQFNQATGSMQAFTTEDYPKSATEISAQQGMLNSRFAEMVRHVETTFLLPALENQLELNQSLMDQNLWIRVVEAQPDPNDIDPFTGMPRSYDPVGPAPMLISPDDIRGDLDIYPVGASWVADNQQQLGQMIQLTQVIAQSPAQGVIKWNEFAKLAYEKAGIRDAFRFIKSDQEIIYDQQQQALAMQNQQQMGPGGPGGPGRPPGPGGPSRNRGVQSVAGSVGAPVGGGAGTGPVQQTAGGPQRQG